MALMGAFLMDSATTLLAHACFSRYPRFVAPAPDDLVILLCELPSENVSFGRGAAQRTHISAEK
jgi:hypothetical protein